MFFLQTGDIIPGKRIGSIEIGKDVSALLELSHDFIVQDLSQNQLYIGGDVQVWVDKTEKIITQIMVYGSFKGTFMGRFGIGSFLGKIEECAGELSYEEDYVYLFESQKGICFELEDIEDDWDSITWFKYNAPIEYISVFM
ncbi:MAG: hypothetical protein K2O91_19195 [Lachnospiraceae bacterium]|nr:hypothetical protein [Lachnospiraceae bacterium]